MKTGNKLMMSGLMALVLGFGVTGDTFAYQNNYTNQVSNYTIDFPDLESQITEAMNNGDYQGWRKLMSENVWHGDSVDVINEANFPRFVEAWKLAKDGNIREANTIRRELGIKSK
jgi:hypothetical protein